VSEIMLQQTRVTAALPYYERFVARFPDVGALARASRGDVLAAWAGLGYYRRARHLHEAAGVVVREHAGRVPSDPRAFAALPGVGRYTLGAVLSMGFGQSLPVLDGNVARVFSRLAAAPVSWKRPADAKQLWSLAERLMPPAGGRDRPGDWNQALMELGALVCTPRSPRCPACPVRAHCAAWARGLQHELPPVHERREVERVHRAVACVWDRGRLLVARREGALLAGLWEPPGVELESGEDGGEALAAQLRALGVRARVADSGRRERHTITHRDITVQVWEGALSAAPPRRASLAWARAGQPSRRRALSALGSRLLAAGPGGEQRNGARAGARAPSAQRRIRRVSRRA
jgi:A/G-specific adenine glycosylase